MPLLTWPPNVGVLYMKVGVLFIHLGDQGWIWLGDGENSFSSLP